jgi:hypothetical protein
MTLQPQPQPQPLATRPFAQTKPRLLLAGIALLATPLSPPTHAAQPQPQLQTRQAPAAQPSTPVPEYRAFDCAVDGRAIQLEELRFKPASQGLELRAALNARAHPNPNCRGGYGGPDIEALLADPRWNPGSDGFDILGAVNGTVFRAEQTRTYISNQLLWSVDKGVIAPLRRGSGNHLFVADKRGGYGATLSFVRCVPTHLPCARLKLPGRPATRPLTTPELIRELRKSFPTLTLALQSNMPLMDSRIDPKSGRFTHWSQCPAQKPNDWRCAPSARTVACAKKDGTISLLTTPSAYPSDLAQGLRRGGSCKVDCEFFYNLDGGGSTQMARPARASGLPAPSGSPRRHEFSGRRIETTQEGCSPLRPVDNYLIVGKPVAAGGDGGSVGR